MNDTDTHASPSIVPRNGGAHVVTDAFRSQTPLQSIAANIKRLVFDDMMLMASDLHADGETIGKTPAETAAALSRWAGRVLDQKDPPERKPDGDFNYR